ncbi:MAG: hypothetical protein R3C26_01595 [Calditrichia bacterium]
MAETSTVSSALANTGGDADRRIEMKRSAKSALPQCPARKPVHKYLHRQLHARCRSIAAAKHK